MELKREIYKAALRLKKSRQRRVELPNFFSASEAGECRRALALRKLNKEPTRTEKDAWDEARVEMLLADGRLHQAAITQYIHNIPNVYITNIEDMLIKPYKNIFVTGHPDGILTEVKEKKNTILEVKGLSRFTCQKLKDGDIETLKEAYPKAIPQSRMYMWLSEIEHAKIIVKDKDRSELYEFDLGHSEEPVLRILEKFNSIFEELTAKRTPACDYLKGDKRCMFCPYPEECGEGR